MEDVGPFVTDVNSDILHDFYIKPSEKEIEKSFNSFFSNGIIPTPYFFDFVVQLMSRKKVEALVESNYDYAEKIDIKLTELLRYDNNHVLMSDVSQNTNTGIEDEKINVESKWKSRINDIEMDGQEKLRILQRAQETEVLDFKRKWQNSELLRSFNKPSNTLMQLRIQEKKMALLKNYSQAKEIKKFADEMQMKEESLANKRYEDRMRIEYIKLWEEQEKEKQRMKEYIQKSISNAEIQKNKELERFSKIKKVMSIKSPTRKKKIAFTPQPNHMDHRLKSPVHTPRTQSKFAEYRSEKRGSLNMSPINDDRFNEITNWKSNFPPLQ